MTNQTPESVIAEVIEYHADDIDTHGPGCYKNHAACLAVKLRDMLREPGEPNDDRDRPTIGLARVISAWDQGKQTTRRIPHWAVGLAAHLIDSGHAVDRATVPDAATEERVKKIILESLVFTNENSDPWAQLLTENILAALEGAPEPEVKP